MKRASDLTSAESFTFQQPASIERRPLTFPSARKSAKTVTERYALLPRRTWYCRHGGDALDYSALSRSSPLLNGLVKGHSTVIIKNGVVKEDALKAAHMSPDDLDEDLREKGVCEISIISEARLERSGKLSVIEK